MLKRGKVLKCPLFTEEITDNRILVYCNGIPKSGTHALERAVQLLGCNTMLAHLPYKQKPPGKQILICRHPKNVMVSWLRFTKGLVTEGFLIGLFKEFDGFPLFDSFARYEPYLKDPSVLVVRFEDLFSDGGETLERVASYLETPVLSDAYRNIVGLTVTYTGEHSDWEEHWTDPVEAAWVEAKGPEVEAIWSY